MTAAPAPAQKNPLEARLDLTRLREHVRARFPADDPFRVAVEALPDSLTREEYLVHLRVLLPLARLREAR